MSVDGQLRQCSECGLAEFDETYLATMQSVTADSLHALQQVKRLKVDGGELAEFLINVNLLSKSVLY